MFSFSCCRLLVSHGACVLRKRNRLLTLKKMTAYHSYSEQRKSNKSHRYKCCRNLALQRLNDNPTSTDGRFCFGSTSQFVVILLLKDIIFSREVDAGIRYEKFLISVRDNEARCARMGETRVSSYSRPDACISLTLIFLAEIRHYSQSILRINCRSRVVSECWKVATGLF